VTATLFPLEEPSGGVCVGVTDETRMHGALSAISERLVALEERMSCCGVGWNYAATRTARKDECFQWPSRLRNDCRRSSVLCRAT